MGPLAQRHWLCNWPHSAQILSKTASPASFAACVHCNLSQSYFASKCQLRGPISRHETAKSCAKFHPARILRQVERDKRIAQNNERERVKSYHFPRSTVSPSFACRDSVHLELRTLKVARSRNL